MMSLFATNLLDFEQKFDCINILTS